MSERITYKDSGVDIDLAEKVIASVSEKIKSTFRPEVMGKMGGFAAMFRPNWKHMVDPTLVSATDGVGTKLKIAFLTGIHDTVGIDLVAMNVNDLLVTGAEPLFFLDYFATGKIREEVITAVIGGIADGCKQANCSLIGGETAEMPDFYPPGEYDLAGFSVGIVDREKSIDGSGIKPGQVVLGVASSGLHSNGFSLVRKVFLEHKKYSLSARFDDLGRTLGEELITPTRIYVRPVLELLQSTQVFGMAHITGGGFTGNIPRILPEDCAVTINKTAWEAPPIFRMLQRDAALDDAEMYRTFNMGVGFILILDADEVENARVCFQNRGSASWVIGEVVERRSGEDQVAIR
jgi:phosphoribosylformylglycinamidine cyclo-ligase